MSETDHSWSQTVNKYRDRTFCVGPHRRNVSFKWVRKIKYGRTSLFRRKPRLKIQFIRSEVGCYCFCPGVQRLGPLENFT